MSRSIFCTTAENDVEKAQRRKRRGREGTKRASKLWPVIPLKGEKYRNNKSS